MEIFIPIIIIACGIFSLLGAVNNWDWFFNNYKAQPFVKIIGRTGARIFYGILGAVIIVLGIVSFGAL